MKKLKYKSFDNHIFLNVQIYMQKVKQIEPTNTKTISSKKKVSKSVSKSTDKKNESKPYLRDLNTQTAISQLLNNNTKPQYIISYQDYNLEITKDTKKVNFTELTSLNYSDNADMLVIKEIIYSLYYCTLNSSNSHLYKKSIEPDKQILYIYLLPFMSSNNKYLMKAGYSSDLTDRKLYGEFGLKQSDIYLLVGIEISSHKKEIILHSELKKLPNVEYYPIVKKDEKDEKDKISNETYIFKLSTIKDILDIMKTLEMQNETNLIMVKNENLKLQTIFFRDRVLLC